MKKTENTQRNFRVEREFREVTIRRETPHCNYPYGDELAYIYESTVEVWDGVRYIAGMRYDDEDDFYDDYKFIYLTDERNRYTMEIYEMYTVRDWWKTWFGETTDPETVILEDILTDWAGPAGPHKPKNAYILDRDGEIIAEYHRVK